MIEWLIDLWSDSIECMLKGCAEGRKINSQGIETHDAFVFKGQILWKIAQKKDKITTK